MEAATMMKSSNSNRMNCLMRNALLVVVVLLREFQSSDQYASSNVETLLRLQSMLEHPSALQGWKNTTDFCNLTSTVSLTVVCYEGAITQLKIVGDKGKKHENKNNNDNGSFVTSTNYTLSSKFSVDSFFTTLYKLSSLKVLSLVNLGIWGPLPDKVGRLSQLVILNISSNYLYGNIPQELSLERDLQTLILDDNMFNGSIPDWISALPSLTYFSCKNNFLRGSVPDSLSALANLRVLQLSGNGLSGNLPDLMSLSNLQELYLDWNNLGPLFPTLPDKIVKLSMSRNNFRFHLPELKHYNRLQKLDLSHNDLIGVPPSSLFALPVISYLSIASNAFTGSFPLNLTCGANLNVVDLSSNFLTGRLPPCLASLIKRKKNVRFYKNCLDTGLEDQHPYLFCKNAATATSVSSRRPKQSSRTFKVAMILGIVGGLVALLAVLGLVLLLVLRVVESKRRNQPPTRKLSLDNVSTGFSQEMLTNARYISQTMRLGALGLPQYRPFDLEELEIATRGFSSSHLMGEGSQGKLYKGRLEDGTFVAVRCLNFEWKYGVLSLKPHLELLSKLRHRHLVSLLGHCVDYDVNDYLVRRIFLVFEFVSNGTLRSNLSGQFSSNRLNWPQRLAALIGVARGIHFLHTGVVPGIYNNNLKITNVLLDQSLVAKLKSYNLPMLADDGDDFELKMESHSLLLKDSDYFKRRKFVDKTDILDFGLILLETMLGRPLEMLQNEANTIEDLLKVMSDHTTRKSIIDPGILCTSNDESLETVVEITCKCLSREPVSRPSMEDVLWNLQYAAQVQETSGADT